MAKKAKAVVEPVEVEADSDESGPVPAGQLGDWKPVLPKEVRDAVDTYVELLREGNLLRGKKNAAEEACLEAMANHEIDRVELGDGSGKFLVSDWSPTLKIEKPKAKKDSDTES